MIPIRIPYPKAGVSGGSRQLLAMIQARGDEPDERNERETGAQADDPLPPGDRLGCEARAG